MPTQNISVTDELAAFVSDQIKAGDYASVSEVYREALRRFRDQEEARKLYLRRLEHELDKGLWDSNEGRVHKICSVEEHEALYRSIEEKIIPKKAHA